MRARVVTSHESLIVPNFPLFAFQYIDISGTMDNSLDDYAIRQGAIKSDIPVDGKAIQACGDFIALDAHDWIVGKELAFGQNFLDEFVGVDWATLRNVNPDVGQVLFCAGSKF
jgi:hypothetical protein